MNDNKPPPLSEPEFDPHRDGKRGFLFGAVGTVLVIGMIIWLI